MNRSAWTRPSRGSTPAPPAWRRLGPFRFVMRRVAAALSMSEPRARRFAEATLDSDRVSSLCRTNGPRYVVRCMSLALATRLCCSRARLAVTGIFAMLLEADAFRDSPRIVVRPHSTPILRRGYAVILAAPRRRSHQRPGYFGERRTNRLGRQADCGWRSGMGPSYRRRTRSRWWWSLAVQRPHSSA